MQPESHPTQPIIFPKAIPTPTQNFLCRALDEWYSKLLGDATNKLYQDTKPSDMFMGVLFAIDDISRNNPDRVSQAAHSLREILYPFKPNYEKKFKKKLEHFQISVHTDINAEEVKYVYEELNKFTHHDMKRQSGTADETSDQMEVFNNLLEKFTELMLQIFGRQLILHKEIDTIVSQGPPETI